MVFWIVPNVLDDKRARIDWRGYLDGASIVECNVTRVFSPSNPYAVASNGAWFSIVDFSATELVLLTDYAARVYAEVEDEAKNQGVKHIVIPNPRATVLQFFIDRGSIN